MRANTGSEARLQRPPLFDRRSGLGRPEALNWLIPWFPTRLQALPSTMLANIPCFTSWGGRLVGAADALASAHL